MKKEYDIEKVIELRDSQNLKWKEIEEIIGVSAETLRKDIKEKRKAYLVQKLIQTIIQNRNREAY